jgi:GNAT superfamily N-acetyltransferase
MIRLATQADTRRIFEIRDGTHDNLLSDPDLVTEASVARFIDYRALWVWQEADGLVAGFSAGDVGNGSIWALFVAPGHDGKGIGRALLKTACDALRESGQPFASLTAAPGTRAERHYRADGWTVAGTNQKGELVFQKPL